MRFNLLVLLENKDMKQSDLARLTGIRYNTINAYYHGYIKRMNVIDLEKICDALECTLYDLIEYVPKKNNCKK